MVGGLGWLRAAAQGYNYSYTKVTLVSNVLKNLQMTTPIKTIVKNTATGVKVASVKFKPIS